MTLPYPERTPERDRWIVALRPPRPALNPGEPQAFLLEEERAESGEVVPVATVFLTNRECPWRCLMCDLWKHTLPEPIPPGAIPAQLDLALRQLPPARQIKLYNSGSFFDPQAIPRQDHAALAERVAGFERIIVECHPALVSESALRFRDLLSGSLEVAMGLETVHPEVLAKLNKRMTLDQFQRAAEFLRRNHIALRVFILVGPPFLERAEGLHWTRRSLEFAFDCGATVASLIPTRPGNGALETLTQQGQFAPPTLAMLEEALDYGLSLARGRVFADLWDLETCAPCPACLAPRRDRLRFMNLTQQARPRLSCARCAASEA